MKRFACCLLIASVVGASCGTNREGSKPSQPVTTGKQVARWTAQYQSPLSAKYAGTQLLGLFSFNAVSVVSHDVVFVAADYPEPSNIEKRYGLVVRTTDGGKTWTEIPVSSSAVKVVALNGVQFLDPAVGWVIGVDSTGRGIILKTTDGGSTWTVTGVGSTMTPTALFFTDPQRGWIGGFTRTSEGDDKGGATDILVTEDGGATWRSQRRIPVSIRDLFFIDQKTGWAAATEGTIYSTTDAGITWNSRRIGVEGPNQYVVGAVHFANASRGWAAGREPDGNSGVIIGTENGGASWTRLFGSNAERIRDLFFVGEAEGWATLWASQYVYHTTDGGKQWEAEQIQFEQYPPLYRLAAADRSHVWAAGGGAIFVRTNE